MPFGLSKIMSSLDNSEILFTYNMDIFLTRHGESVYNTLGKLGGNSGLSKRGSIYAEKLANYFNKYDNLKVITSKLDRTIETAAPLIFTKESQICLNEINAGICEHFTYEEIKEKYPNINKSRSLDKLNYRYPEGESYMDLIERVDYFINDLKKFSNKKILIIAHQAVLRAFIGLLSKKSYKDIPYISVPLHSVKHIRLDNDFNIIKTESIIFEI